MNSHKGRFQIEGMDLAIRIGRLDDSDLIARRLSTFEIWPCASPEYLERSDQIIHPTDLLRQTLISHSDQRETWEFRTATGAVRDIEVAPGMVIPEPEVLKRMLIAGTGIGLLPDFHAADAIRDRKLVRLLPAYQGRTLDAHILYHSHRSLSAKVRVFIDTLVEEFAPLEVSEA